jgi:hypothetical protein
MKLKEIVERIDEFDDDATIYAMRPWMADSEATVVVPDAQHDVMRNVEEKSLEYFLEIFVAREALEVLDRDPTVDRMAALLIYYAENDAYPPWGYES